MDLSVSLEHVSREMFLMRQLKAALTLTNVQANMSVMQTQSVPIRHHWMDRRLLMIFTVARANRHQKTPIQLTLADHVFLNVPLGLHMTQQVRKL